MARCSHRTQPMIALALFPRRPGWKRLARRARSAFYRSQRRSIGSPAGGAARCCRRRTCALLLPDVEPEGVRPRVRHARLELTSRGLRPEHRVLDIGSGIGNLALGLVGFLRGGYDGIEIHPEAVAWCQRAITRRHPRSGSIARIWRAAPTTPRAGDRVDLPVSVPGPSFDFIFLGSVFTHMLPDAVEHYVREISRLLAPGGVCVASCFLLNDETRAGVDAAGASCPFASNTRRGCAGCTTPPCPKPPSRSRRHSSGASIEEAGLRIRDIRRGRWWSGGPHDHDVLTVVPQIESIVSSR